MELVKVYNTVRVDNRLLIKMDMPSVEEIEKRYGVKAISPYEDTVEKWFLDNYRKLGFIKIRKTEEGIRDPGDYAGLRSGKWIRIELETFSSGFFLHKDEIRDKIDMVICLEKQTSRLDWKNRELQSKEVIELKKVWGTKLIHENYIYDFLYDQDEDFRIKYRRLLHERMLRKMGIKGDVEKVLDIWK